MIEQPVDLVTLMLPDSSILQALKTTVWQITVSKNTVWNLKVYHMVFRFVFENSLTTFIRDRTQLILKIHSQH